MIPCSHLSPAPSRTGSVAVLLYLPLNSYGRTTHTYGRDCSGAQRECGIADLFLLLRKTIRCIPPGLRYVLPLLNSAMRNMQGGGVPHVDGHGMLCNVMHHDNRWQRLLGFLREIVY